MLSVVSFFHALINVMPAALQTAFKGSKGTDGFSELTAYIGTISGYAIPLGCALAVLGLIYGGCLLMVGAPHAGRTLSYVVFGVIIVLSSKGLAL
jgi:hypothetical protein